MKIHVTIEHDTETRLSSVAVNFNDPVSPKPPRTWTDSDLSFLKDIDEETGAVTAWRMILKGVVQQG